MKLETTNNCHIQGIRRKAPPKFSEKKDCALNRLVRLTERLKYRTVIERPGAEFMKKMYVPHKAYASPHAFGCNNLADKRSVVQFHGFPFKRPLILKEWIKAIRRDNWQPMKFSKLYSDHFLTSDYEDIGEKIYRRLKDSAIPSVFKFPQHLQKKIAPRRVLKRCLPNHTVGGDNNLNEDLNEIRLLSV
ncbi:hypothetical protein NQ314_009285, partial [Rhamnusium bicolor]